MKARFARERTIVTLSLFLASSLIVFGVAFGQAANHEAADRAARRATSIELALQEAERAAKPERAPDVRQVGQDAVPTSPQRQNPTDDPLAMFNTPVLQ